MERKTKKVAVIVAHPDDETLWAGSIILSAPYHDYFIVSLCRKSDPDRAPKFEKALRELGAQGIMGDLDDGPDQLPLSDQDVENAILNLLPSRQFSRIITHSPFGEYTRHRRHEEVGRAVISLWRRSELKTSQLWLFAYNDGGGVYLPIANDHATITYTPPHPVWQRKYNIITKIYGFNPNTWEAQTTPKHEAFWMFNTAAAVYEWKAACGTITL